MTVGVLLARTVVDRSMESQRIKKTIPYLAFSRNVSLNPKLFRTRWYLSLNYPLANTSSPATTPQQRHSFNKEAILKSPPQVQSSEVVLAAILKLREQHGTLSELIHNLASMNSVSAPMMQRGLAENGSTSTLGHGTIRSPMSPRVRSALQRASMSSVTDSIWYDAEEYGAEEYIMNDEPEDETVVMTRGSSTLTGDTNLSTERGGSDEDVDIATVDDTPDEKVELPINMRTRLPARPNGDEGSLFAILKKNVGQVIYIFAIPVNTILSTSPGSFKHLVPSHVQRTINYSTASCRGDGIL